jgi:cytochrome oxidase Cu insertion factor (SCO1/SenC/PrrC family)
MNAALTAAHIAARKHRGGGPRPPKILIVLCILAASAMVFSFTMLVRGPKQSAAPLGTTAEAPAVMGAPGALIDEGPPPEALALLNIPDFTMLDQNGAEHTRDIFKDKWTVLAFTFTNCPTACPIMHSHLLRAQQLLAGTPVRIVTISVDPANDTPAAMKSYAAKIQADESRWTFLSGDQPTMQSIVQGLKFALRDDPAITVNLPDGRTMPNILHPTQFIIIGPDIKVAGLEPGTRTDSAERLEAKLRKLLAATGSPR